MVPGGSLTQPQARSAGDVSSRAQPHQSGEYGNSRTLSAYIYAGKCPTHERVLKLTSATAMFPIECALLSTRRSGDAPAFFSTNCSSTFNTASTGSFVSTVVAAAEGGVLLPPAVAAVGVLVSIGDVLIFGDSASRTGRENRKLCKLASACTRRGVATMGST